ncbi:MAG TPA: DUF255 domain-containing protein [Longimicrobiales bacterium]|nr:DUF255 domain-containing protein [Longimicrobiales bacterium]
MPEPFRFTHREHHADRVRWRPWGPEAFEEAQRTETPLLLHLVAVWPRACQEMDEVTYSDPRVIDTLNESLIPVRVDADRSPHIQDRYIAGGWPTVALLTPTGEVFWSGTYTEPKELLRVVEGVLAAWRDRREELREEIGRRRKAMEAARSRRPAFGLVRREAADDVITGAQDQFDPRNGGFGEAPKFLHAEAVELFFAQADRLPNTDWTGIAERTLDGILAGEIEDPVEGGFFHYALEADWTRPQTEKLLQVNARALGAFACGAARLGREHWTAAAERTIAWVESTLRRPDGLWSGSQAADAEYFAADAHGRAALCRPPVDDTAYAHSCGMWITALANAGRLLERPEWVTRASEALDVLLETMAAPGDSLVHYRAPGGEPPAGLLVDLVHCGRAAAAVAEATRRDSALAHARRLATTMERDLWHEGGGFLDHPPAAHPLGALRYQDRPFEENALAARLLLRLSRLTRERTFRALAERTLALLSPLAGRYAVEGASFAMAVEEFFELRGG